MSKESPLNERLEFEEKIKNAAASLYKWLKKNGIAKHDREDHTGSNKEWYIKGVKALNLLWEMTLDAPHDFPDTYMMIIAEISQGINNEVHGDYEKGKESSFLIEVRDDNVVVLIFSGDPDDPDYGANDDEIIAINTDELLEIIAALELSDPEELRHITVSSEEEQN